MVLLSKRNILRLQLAPSVKEQVLKVQKILNLALFVVEKASV